MGLMRSYAFFKSLANSAIVNILLEAKYQATRPLQLVFQQREPADRFYVLLKGEVTICMNDKERMLEVMHKNRIARQVPYRPHPRYGRPRRAKPAPRALSRLSVG